MMYEGELNVLGEFELKGSVLRISDPCYERDVWCCGTIDNCVPGTWQAAVLVKDEGEWGDRVAVLAARYAETGPKFNGINRAKCNGTGQWHHAEFEVGVDSGQAGIFDDDHYQKDSDFPNDPANDFGSRWYSSCCDVTLGRMKAGMIPYGVVSSSGYGDGGYGCTLHRNMDGQVDFVFISFIEDEEE